MLLAYLRAMRPRRECELLLNSVGDANCRPAYVETLRDGAAAGRVPAVRGLPAARGDEPAARARLQGARGPARHRVRCRRSPTTSARSAAPTSPRCARELDLLRHPVPLSHRLVRGLDYYVRTTFEVLGAGWARRTALLRRRPLRRPGARSWAAPTCPGIGFALGMERLVMSRADGGRRGRRCAVFLAPLAAAGAGPRPRRPGRLRRGGRGRAHGPTRDAA